MEDLQRYALFIIGCVFIITGAALMVWDSVQRSRRALPGSPDLAPLVKAVTELIEALAKIFPEYAGRVGAFLILVGLILVGLSVFA